MRLYKLCFIVLILTFLLTFFTINTPAVTNSDLPWNWVKVGLKDEDIMFGVGTRNPNLGDNIGLEFGTTYKNKNFSPELDLLYFFDPSDSFSLNVGIGVFVDNNGVSTKYSTAYSGGIWFHLANTVMGVGYNSCSGITLRCGLWF